MDEQHSDETGSASPERQDLDRRDVAGVDGLADVPEEVTSEVTTGVSEVDAVLASLDGLDGRPVAEHVEVFEKAHERLRRALDTPAD